jgi:hypothetical protein
MFTAKIYIVQLQFGWLTFKKEDKAKREKARLHYMGTYYFEKRRDALDFLAGVQKLLMEKAEPVAEEKGEAGGEGWGGWLYGRGDA